MSDTKFRTSHNSADKVPASRMVGNKRTDLTLTDDEIFTLSDLLAGTVLPKQEGRVYEIKCEDRSLEQLAEDLKASGSVMLSNLPAAVYYWTGVQSPIIPWSVVNVSDFLKLHVPQMATNRQTGTTPASWLVANVFRLDPEGKLSTVTVTAKIGEDEVSFDFPRDAFKRWSRKANETKTSPATKTKTKAS